MTKALSIFAGFFCVLVGVAAQAEHPASFEAGAATFLRTYCWDCHGDGAEEGGIRLDDLQGVTAENAETWKSVWEQVALKAMPPRDSSELPSLIQRHELSSWITSQLQLALDGKGGFTAHLLPAKGNHLDHDLLFGPRLPESKPSSSPARLWRLHPQEHLTRLSALINQEPAYDPARPGQRTKGDFVPPNEEGEVKVYYGLDRVIGWVGGTAAYAASITGFPPVLSVDDHHGLRSYPMLSSVNGAEAIQLARHAETILRFMAYGPDAEPYQFADRVADIDPKYKHGDLRGLAEALFYSNEVKRPLTPVYDLMREPGVSDERLTAAIDYLFKTLTGRKPTETERINYLNIVNESIRDLGKEEGAILGLASIFLDRDALFRPELVTAGEADSHGRVMLQGDELALAINAAFCYLGPDEALSQAVEEGRLRTRDDVRREVTRIVANPSIRKPRLLQFFREYFDYDRAGGICKDSKALRSAGGDPNELKHYRIMFLMVANTDRLIEMILAEDENVLRELLTTDRVVLNPASESPYFGQFISSARPVDEPGSANAKKRNTPKRSVTIEPFKPTTGQDVSIRIARVVQGDKGKRKLANLPTDQRMGILTHPAWLVSHSDAMDNHAITRGKWIRERLLGDAVPDVPITVDAMLPDEPGETLRHRMRVTRESECWRCHQKMDPLGLPFEMYNHLGLYRTVEHDQPVDTSGEIIFCCVDSIAARAAIWRSLRSRCKLWIDGRMLGEVIRILSASEPAEDRHYETTLFDPANAQAGSCTSKGTIYTASIAAGLMVHQLTRQLRGLPLEPDLVLNLLATELAVP